MTEENPYAPPEGELKGVTAWQSAKVAERNRWVGRLRFAAQAFAGGTVLAVLLVLLIGTQFNAEKQMGWTTLMALLLLLSAAGLRIGSWRLKAHLRQQGQWDEPRAMEGFLVGEKLFWQVLGKGLLAVFLGMAVVGLLMGK